MPNRARHPAEHRVTSARSAVPILILLGASALIPEPATREEHVLPKRDVDTPSSFGAFDSARPPEARTVAPLVDTDFVWQFPVAHAEDRPDRVAPVVDTDFVWQFPVAHAEDRPVRVALRDTS